MILMKTPLGTEEQVIRKSLLYRLMQGINTMPHLEVLEVRSHLPTTLVPIKSALILNQLRVLSLSLEATDLNLLKRISKNSSTLIWDTCGRTRASQRVLTRVWASTGMSTAAAAKSDSCAWDTSTTCT